MGPPPALIRVASPPAPSSPLPGASSTPSTSGNVCKTYLLWASLQYLLEYHSIQPQLIITAVPFMKVVVGHIHHDHTNARIGINNHNSSMRHTSPFICGYVHGCPLAKSKFVVSLAVAHIYAIISRMVTGCQAIFYSNTTEDGYLMVLCKPCW